MTVISMTRFSDLLTPEFMQEHDGLSISELASLVGCSPATIKRARQKIRTTNIKGLNIENKKRKRALDIPSKQGHLDKLNPL